MNATVKGLQTLNGFERRCIPLEILEPIIEATLSEVSGFHITCGPHGSRVQILLHNEREKHNGKIANRATSKRDREICNMILSQSRVSYAWREIFMKVLLQKEFWFRDGRKAASFLDRSTLPVQHIFLQYYDYSNEFLSVVPKISARQVQPSLTINRYLREPISSYNNQTDEKMVTLIRDLVYTNDHIPQKFRPTIVERFDDADLSLPIDLRFLAAPPTVATGKCLPVIPLCEDKEQMRGLYNRVILGRRTSIEARMAAIRAAGAKYAQRLEAKRQRQLEQQRRIVKRAARRAAKVAAEKAKEQRKAARQHNLAASTETTVTKSKGRVLSGRVTKNSASASSTISTSAPVSHGNSTSVPHSHLQATSMLSPTNLHPVEQQHFRQSHPHSNTLSSTITSPEFQLSLQQSLETLLSPDGPANFQNEGSQSSRQLNAQFTPLPPSQSQTTTQLSNGQSFTQLQGPINSALPSSRIPSYMLNYPQRAGDTMQPSSNNETDTQRDNTSSYSSRLPSYASHHFQQSGPAVQPLGEVQMLTQHEYDALFDEALRDGFYARWMGYYNSIFEER